MQDCDEVLSFEPGRGKALMRRGEAKEALGRFDEAIEDLKKAAVRDHAFGRAGARGWVGVTEVLVGDGRVLVGWWVGWGGLVVLCRRRWRHHPRRSRRQSRGLRRGRPAEGELQQQEARAGREEPGCCPPALWDREAWGWKGKKRREAVSLTCTWH